MTAPAPGRRDIDVVAIGETMVMLVPNVGRLADAESLHVGIGGAESNTASYLAAAGRAVSWVSAVGDDPFGERVLREVSRYGVDVSHVTVVPGAPTGVYFKDPSPLGSRAFYYRRCSAASRLSMDAADLPDFHRTRVVHMSGITLALSAEGRALVGAVREQAQAAGALFSFDVNYRPALWPPVAAGPALLEHAQAADLVFVGMDEARAVWGCATAHDVHALMPSGHVIVKDGPIGVTAFPPGDVAVFSPARPIEVIEPVGAGDAFAAGYLHALLSGRDEPARLDSGHRFAAAALRSSSDVAGATELQWATDSRPEDFTGGEKPVSQRAAAGGDGRSTRTLGSAHGVESQ